MFMWRTTFYPMTLTVVSNNLTDALILNLHSKLRHVKCGEILPHCQRDVKFKRLCLYTAPLVKPNHPVHFITYTTAKEPHPFSGLHRSER